MLATTDSREGGGSRGGARPTAVGASRTAEVSVGRMGAMAMGARGWRLRCQR